MTEYLAKPDQTYDEHIYAAYKAWKEITAAKCHLIDDMADALQISSERFLQSSLLIVVLHDIGKMCIPFQNMMNTINAGGIIDFHDNYRHEVASFPYVSIYSNSLELITQRPLCQLKGIEALVVLGHHKSLTGDLNSFSREAEKNINGQELEWSSGGIEHALSVAADIFSKEGYDFPDVSLKEYKSPYGNTSGYIRNIFGLIYKRISCKESTRMAFALLKAILYYSDWYGSAGESISDFPQMTAELLKQHLRERCEEQNKTFSGFTEFQKRCLNCNTNLIAIAPTGSGKTEASILWAQNGFTSKKKLIYLLPTMVTANSLFLRLENYFSGQKTGLTHSTAVLFKESELDNYTVKYGDILREKTFMLPITVSTIDQLLFSGYNKGYWTLTEVNVANSMIVIDEIHAYDPWTLGLICSAIRHFSQFGAKFMIMSATMPKYLKELLSENLPDVEVIEDTYLLEQSRNRFSIHPEKIEEAVLEIRSAFSDGKKVLVVVNSVSSCQNLAKILEDLCPICYHSKFIFKDRNKKEKFILEQGNKQESCLFVATQVVEVSLDIDFDILFTECAPPDALVQRAGRVNRARKKTGTEVRIYQPSEMSNKIYESAGVEILEKTLSVLSKEHANLTEADLISIVERVYSGTQISDNPDFRQAINQYRETQDRLMAILDNPQSEMEDSEVTRKTTYLQTSVIPFDFKHEVLSLPPNERRRYEIKMPLWYVRQHKKVIDGILFCEMEYDDVYGAQYSGKTDIQLIV